MTSVLKMRKAEALLGQRQATLQRTKTQLVKDGLERTLTQLAQNRKTDKHRGGTNAKAVEVDSSDEYDTDLEVEVRDPTPFDRSGSVVYVKTCRKLGIKPIGVITRGLKTADIRLCGRGLHTHETLALCNALLENLSVKTLTLDDNQIGPDGTEYVSSVLYENDFIYSLSMASNNIGQKGFSSICHMLLDNSSLLRLNISGNALEDRDASLISTVLEQTKNLTYLNLSHNNFGDDTAKFLGPAIGVPYSYSGKNESLRILDLSWNHFRPPGGVLLCEGVRENVVMTTINLAYNGLSIPGAVAMAEALEENDILTDLDLTCNRIFDEGAVRIGKALLVNETLSKLKLANNPMTTASATTLLTVLKENEYSALEYVNMSSIHLYKDALKLIKEIQGIRPTFDFIYGGVVSSDDQIGVDGAAFNNKNPFTILKEFMAAKNLRLVDLFKQMDKDGSGSVSKDEFITGLNAYEVPLTRNQVDRLIAMLDKDGDGEVDYQELVTADKEHRRKQRAKMEAVIKMKKLHRKKAKEAKEAARLAEAAAKEAIPGNK